MRAKARTVSKTTTRKPSLCEVIADYMVNHGTQNTFSGNWHFDFDEISEMFDVSLPDDEQLLSDIEEAVWRRHGDEVLELLLSEDFDFLFCLASCPYAGDGDDDELWPY